MGILCFKGNLETNAPVSFISKAQETNKPNLDNKNTPNVGIFNFDGKTNITSMFNNSSTKPIETNDEQKPASAGFFANAPSSQPSMFNANNNVFAKKDESS